MWQAHVELNAVGGLTGFSPLPICFLSSLVDGGSSHLVAVRWAGRGRRPSSSLRDPGGPSHQAYVSSPVLQ